MTVEEKALYLDRANKYWYQNTNIIGLYSKESELDVKNAYIDGLAEGKKEGILSMLDKCEEFRHKANELEEENAEYEKENAELFENCKDKDRQLNNWFMSYNEVKKENAELKAQIEPLLERITNLRRNYTSLQKENESPKCCRMTERKYRPFKDCDELIGFYKENWCSDLGEYDLPTIWVRPKGRNTGGDMITDSNATSVRVLGTWWSLKDLFKTYTFLDGSICGVEE